MNYEFVKANNIDNTLYEIAKDLLDGRDSMLLNNKAQNLLKSQVRRALSKHSNKTFRRLGAEMNTTLRLALQGASIERVLVVLSKHYRYLIAISNK